MSTTRPIGRRFSHVYLEAGPPIHQSPRLQRRVAEFFVANFSGAAHSVWVSLRVELGAKARGVSDVWSVNTFLNECSAIDFLEAITVIAASLKETDQKRGSGLRKAWLEFVSRALREENLAYELDQAGGVHPKVDIAFQGQKSEAVAMLSVPRYASALAHFKGAYESLDGSSPNTNRAIREIHLAVEDVFKLIQPSASRLDAGEIGRFKSTLAEHFSGPELEALKLLLAAAADYSSASHQYRHAPGAEDPQPATIDTAVFMLSQGTSFLRWMISFDQRSKKAA